jgi:hypothetical protein
MDWFFGIFDRIIQNRILYAILHGFSWVDWITIAFVCIGLVYGLKQGMFRAMAVCFETCVVLWIVFALEKKFAAVISANLAFLKESTVRPFAYLLLLIVVSIGAIVIDEKLRNTFHTKIAGPVKYTGGAIFGVILLLLFWSLVSKFLVLLPITALHTPYGKGGSRTGQFVVSMAPKVYKFINSPFEKKARS